MPQIRTQDIKDNAVTNDKMAQMPAYTMRGNDTAGTANATDLTVDQIMHLMELRGKMYAATQIGINLY